VQLTNKKPCNTDGLKAGEVCTIEEKKSGGIYAYVGFVKGRGDARDMFYIVDIITRNKEVAKIALKTWLADGYLNIAYTGGIVESDSVAMEHEAYVIDRRFELTPEEIRDVKLNGFNSEFINDLTVRETEEFFRENFVAIFESLNLTGFDWSKYYIDADTIVKAYFIHVSLNSL
jgi:hypothetical protein